MKQDNINLSRSHGPPEALNTTRLLKAGSGRLRNPSTAPFTKFFISCSFLYLKVLLKVSIDQPKQKKGEASHPKFDYLEIQHL